MWNEPVMKLQVNILARGLYLEFARMDLDSDETSRDIGTAVLHRILIRITWAEWFGLGDNVWKSAQMWRILIILPNMHVHFSRNWFPKRVFPHEPTGSLEQWAAPGAEPLENAGGLGGRRSPPQDAILIQSFHITVLPDTQVRPKWLVLQYSQKSRLYQNGWSFSISRKAGCTKVAGFSVFPDSRVENQVLRPKEDFSAPISSQRRPLNIF